MTACVADGQYTCEKTDDGAEITYCVGEMTGQLKIPLALSEERFAAVCESIGDEFSRARVENDYRLAEQNDTELIGRYPLLAQQPLYILSDTVQASGEQQKRLAASCRRPATMRHSIRPTAPFSRRTEKRRKRRSFVSCCGCG